MPSQSLRMVAARFAQLATTFSARPSLAYKGLSSKEFQASAALYVFLRLFAIPRSALQATQPLALLDSN